MALFDAESSYVQMTESDMKWCQGASRIKLPIVLVSHCLSKVHQSQLCTCLSLGYSESTHNCSSYTTVLSRLWYCCLGLTLVYWTTSAFFSPSYLESEIQQFTVTIIYFITFHVQYGLFIKNVCSECNKNIYLLNIIGHMCPHLDLSIFIFYRNQRCDKIEAKD